MTRRDFVSRSALGTAMLVAGSEAAAAADEGARTNFNGTPPKSAMGIATTSYLGYGRPQFRQSGATLAFLEHCHKLGAAGIQAPLSSADPADLKKLRGRAEELGMYIETMIPFAKGSDVSAFEKGLGAAKEVGALAVRTGSEGGRRYEKWNSLADWNAFLKESAAATEAMARATEKARIPVGMENHKDWTYDELLMAMRHLAGEYFGVTMDFGNNIALLDAPEAVIELAPYARVTHVKDMALEPYPDGFLLSEVVLGEGILDLKKLVAAVREKQPRTRFTLEMITREPLEVPCLTEKYWVTFPQRPGVYLARTLRRVRQEAARNQPLPRYKQLDKASQVRVEEDNIKICLHYAREQLAL